MAFALRGARRVLWQGGRAVLAQESPWTRPLRRNAGSRHRPMASHLRLARANVGDQSPGMVPDRVPNGAQARGPVAGKVLPPGNVPIHVPDGCRRDRTCALGRIAQGDNQIHGRKQAFIHRFAGLTRRVDPDLAHESAVLRVHRLTRDAGAERFDAGPADLAGNRLSSQAAKGVCASEEQNARHGSSARIAIGAYSGLHAHRPSAPQSLVCVGFAKVSSTVRPQPRRMGRLAIRVSGAARSRGQTG